MSNVAQAKARCVSVGNPHQFWDEVEEGHVQWTCQSCKGGASEKKVVASYFVGRSFLFLLLPHTHTTRQVSDDAILIDFINSTGRNSREVTIALKPSPTAQ